MFSIVSKNILLWIWELPQNGLGLLFLLTLKALGRISKVEEFEGATVVKTDGIQLPIFGGRGVTLGRFIIGNKTMEAKPSNELFQHEFGHYLQSKKSGWFYLSKFGLPSALSAAGKKKHYRNGAEQDANIRAFVYFNHTIIKNESTHETVKSKSLWYKANNIIVGYLWDLAPSNTHNRQILNKGRLKLAWYDFLLLPLNITIIGIIVPGIINAIILYKKQ